MLPPLGGTIQVYVSGSLSASVAVTESAAVAFDNSGFGSAVGPLVISGGVLTGLVPPNSKAPRSSKSRWPRAAIRRARIVDATVAFEVVRQGAADAGVRRIDGRRSGAETEVTRSRRDPKGIALDPVALHARGGPADRRASCRPHRSTRTTRRRRRRGCSPPWSPG